MERERRKKGEGAGWRTRAYKGEEERGGGVRKKRRERWEGRSRGGGRGGVEEGGEAKVCGRAEEEGIGSIGS